MKKNRLALVLTLVVLLTSCLNCSVVFAETTQYDIQLVFDNTICQENSPIVLPDGVLKADFHIYAHDELKMFTYIFDEGSEQERSVCIDKDIPQNISIENCFTIGSKHNLRCRALYANGEVIDKIFIFNAVTQHQYMELFNIDVMLNGVPMSQMHYYDVGSDDVVLVNLERLTDNSNVELLGYCWANPDTYAVLTDMFNFKEGNYTIDIPTEYLGTRKALFVETMLLKDGNYKESWFVYYFNFGRSISMTVTLNDEEMYAYEAYGVHSEDRIVVEAQPLEDSEISFIGYFFVDAESNEALTEENIEVIGNYAEIVLPKYEPSKELILWIEPVDALDDGRPSLVTKTGWQPYFLVFQENTESYIEGR